MHFHNHIFTFHLHKIQLKHNTNKATQHIQTTATIYISKHTNSAYLHRVSLQFVCVHYTKVKNYAIHTKMSK